jgi:peptidoglycan/LPS O-acetylase OafA/YrhL
MRIYRRDIDGLRAVAICAVVLNHAHAPGFGGGFLGVDVFFVISGFLITNILTETSTPLVGNLAAFYERRIRRIVPALAVLLLACCAAALVLLSPSELKEFAGELIAATGFAANLHFMGGDDYFATRFDRPLLHLWSIGVEEQFYLIYPLFVLTMRRYARRWLLATVILVFLLSLGRSLYLGMHEPILAFYATDARLWEIMLGAIVALNPWRPTLPQPAAALVEAVALLALLTPVTLFNEHTIWPGLHALVPCVGTALLLAQTGTRPTWVSRALGAKPLVAIGLISYSLYLWHWPIFQFYGRVTLRLISATEYALLIVASLLIACSSYQFIERPFRRKGVLPTQASVFQTAAAVAAVFFAAGCAGYFGQGFPARYTPLTRQIYSYLNYRDTPGFRAMFGANSCFARPPAFFFDYQRCFVEAPNAANVVLWGDSHATNYYPGFAQEAARDGIHVIEATFGGCDSNLTSTRANAACRTFNQEILHRLDDHIMGIILSSRLYPPDGDLPRFLDTVRQITARGIRVVVLGPSLQYRLPEPLYAARYTKTGDDGTFEVGDRLDPQLVPIDRAMQKLFAGERGVTYVSIYEHLCSAGRCLMTASGQPLQFDESHLTLESSMFVAKILWPVVAEGVAPKL